MSSAFPNEPNGFTSVYDVPFTNALAPNMFNVYNTASYVNDPTAPLSPPWVFESFLAVGSGEGNGQWGGLLNRPREVFVGFYWKTNNDFQGLPNNNNKLFFIKGQQSSGDNSFLVFQGGEDAPKTLKWYQQGVVNNTHVPNTFGMNWPTDGTGWFNPNINSAAATFNANSPWRRVEIHLKASTTFTSRDGSIRIWVNGTLSTSHVNIVNICPNGFEEWQINHAWDNPSCAALRSDCTRRWSHYWDQVYVSVPSTTGGGSTPTLSSLTPVTVSLAPGNTQAMSVGMTSSVSSNTVISLSSSSTAVATVPSTVTVNAGQSTAGFTCTAVAAGTSTVTAALSGVNRTSAVTVASSGGGGGSQPSDSTYTYTTQFSSTQGSNQWSYRDTAGNLLTYNSSNGLWQNAAAPYLGIWNGGFHPGYSIGAVLRWTAPGAGSVRVTGSVQDVDTTASDGVLFSVKYGASSTLYSKDLSGSDSASYAYDVTQSVSSGEFIDFIVEAKTSGAYDSTSLAPTVVFTPAGGSSNPSAPTISSFTPSHGNRGSSVTITGLNFNSTPINNTVTINGVPATVTSASSTQLIITVPPTATTGNIVVTTSAGTATGTTYTVDDPVTPDVPPATNFGGSAMLLLVLP